MCSITAAGSAARTARMGTFAPEGLAPAFRTSGITLRLISGFPLMSARIAPSLSPCRYSSTSLA